MKDFKPTGYGMRSGFHYPSSMGFTSSTGRTTSVSGYTRRKGYAKGGFVREDNPRMKVESPGDPGHALQQRNKPSNNLDQESGGRTPLRPGFKKGGALGKAMRKARGGPASLTGYGWPQRKAKGGHVPRGSSSSKSFTESIADVPKLLKELARHAISRPRVGTGMADRAAKLIGGRKRVIDRTVDEASGVGSGYRKGGTVKKKRMGYANGGGVSRKEAKKIAESTVGEHVRYPAPKGHKGLKSC